MADPVTLALKGASTAFELCRGIYGVIQGIKKAPDEIKRVATDLKGFYGVLGALQHSIEDQRAFLSAKGPAFYQLQNVQSLLDDCVEAFKELQARVQDFVALNGKVIGGIQEAFAWDQFQKEDVQLLRTHLSNIKLSLNLALSSLTLLIASQTSQEVTRTHIEVKHVHQEIRQLRVQLKSSAQTLLPVNDANSIRASINSVTSVASFASYETVASINDSIHDFVTRTESAIRSADIGFENRTRELQVSDGKTQHQRSTSEQSTAPVDSSKPGDFGEKATTKFNIYGTVKYDFRAERPDELDAREGEVLFFSAQSTDPEWVIAKPLMRLGGPGLIPWSFLKIKDGTTDRVLDEAALEVAKTTLPGVLEWKNMAAQYVKTSITLDYPHSSLRRPPTPPPLLPREESERYEKAAKQRAVQTIRVPFDPFGWGSRRLAKRTVKSQIFPEQAWLYDPLQPGHPIRKQLSESRLQQTPDDYDPQITGHAVHDFDNDKAIQEPRYGSARSIGLKEERLRVEEERLREIEIKVKREIEDKRQELASCEQALKELESRMAAAKLSEDRRPKSESVGQGTSPSTINNSKLGSTALEHSRDEADAWIPQATPDGRLWYFNTLTGESKKDLPVEDSAGINEPGKNLDANSTVDQKFSEFWMPQAAPDGRIFYYNTITGESHED